MKKLTVLGMMMFLANVTFAQQTPVQFGLKAGASIATLKQDAATADHKVGLYAGGLAHVHLSRNFALQPELMYAAQGAEYANNKKDKLHYINLPVLGQYMFANGLRLQTGPQLGLLVNAKSENGNHETSFRDAFKKADLSWTFGTSYLTRSRLGIDARYNLGLTDISKATGDMRNRVWQVGLFYQFS